MSLEILNLHIGGRACNQACCQCVPSMWCSVVDSAGATAHVPAQVSDAGIQRYEVLTGNLQKLLNVLPVLTKGSLHAYAL